MRLLPIATALASFALAACAGADGTAGEPSAPPTARTATAPAPGNKSADRVRRAWLQVDVARRRLLLGYSTRGRPIRALELGNPARERRVLVVGCIHGDERAGIAIVRRLEQTTPTQLDLWLLANLNPDGRALGVRQNGRGVDLNRNFPSHWQAMGEPWDPQYSGPRPRSEPETRIASNLIARARPTVTIWYHQYRGAVPFVRAWGQSIPVARRFARLSGIRFRPMAWPAGTAPNWQNHRFPGTSSFVVEFPPGSLDDRTVRRHARAALELGYPP